MKPSIHSLRTAPAILTQSGCRKDLPPARGGFTRMDALALAGSIALLFLLVAMPLARSDGVTKTRALACLDNLRRLSLAWTLFSNDHNGTLPANYGYLMIPGKVGWTYGMLDWTSAASVTNVAWVSDPAYSSLATYLGRNASVFRCPADTYLGSTQRRLGGPGRIRSYSMDACIGSDRSSFTADDPVLVTTTTMTELVNPGPADSFVFLEEHPDSINDSSFMPPVSNRFVDLPASHHDKAANLTYADGHAAPRLWETARMAVPVRYSYLGLPGIPNDPDYLWMRSKTPRKP